MTYFTSFYTVEVVNHWRHVQTFGFITVWLVVSTPLKNMKVNWDDYSQHMEKYSKPPISLGLSRFILRISANHGEITVRCGDDDFRGAPPRYLEHQPAANPCAAHPKAQWGAGRMATSQNFCHGICRKIRRRSYFKVGKNPPVGTSLKNKAKHSKIHLKKTKTS